MYKTISFSLLVFFMVCTTSLNDQPELIYKTREYILYTNKVVQGNFEANILSPTHIVSNYKSELTNNHSRLIVFKFSINGEDNENGPGANHWVIIDKGHISPLIKFGEKPQPVPKDPGITLPDNYTYTFRLDMSPVFEQFNKQGYYKTWNGEKIMKEDFTGIYIVGNSHPLTWDFTLLNDNFLKLKKSNDKNIYEITLLLNPGEKEDFKQNEWKPESDLTNKPKYESEQVIVDALFHLSLEEALKNIEPDSTLRTGAKWEGVWTRDISYSIYLAFAYHEPEIARISLLKKVKRGRIIQDTGSGGAWPVSTDRTTWAIAAWELYKITGDKNWLQEAFTIIKNSLNDDRLNAYNPETGLYKGESSFLDWREQSYPIWMSNADIYKSENLGTNIIHYQAHVVLVKMARILDEPYQLYSNRAEELKDAINQHFWMTKKGFYAQYLYGRTYLNVSPRFETLGEALAVIFDVADFEQAQSIITNSPVTQYGTTCFYPQIPGIPPYHNNAIWPFVQAYWNLAAAKAGNENALNHGLAAIYRAGALFLTNYENLVAETGGFNGTEINSSRMLWSIAGNLAMVHRIFIGMHFEPDGIYFNPCIPENYGGTRTLSNFNYRDANLNITVKGFGQKIKTFSLDGQAQDSAFCPAGLKGTHHIIIEMENKMFDQQTINLVQNHFSLPTPDLFLNENKISWNKINKAVEYLIYKNGKLHKKTNKNSLVIDRNKVAEFKVSAVDTQGWESFTSEPLMIYPDKSVLFFEIEDYPKKSKLPFNKYSGEGFVEVSNEKNRVLILPVEIEEAGNYIIDLRYSNGSGPWNTDNKCAIRSIYIDKNYVGTLVFPQRGTDKWSDWGFSNSHIIKLNKGSNTLKILFEPWNINMNIEVNRAMLDYVRLINLSE